MSHDDEKDNILSELERIVGTGEFSKSARIVQLLTYLVTETLAGRGEQLKAYSIGLEVFGRGEDFDPQSDSIVRVQVGRMRRMLDNYYLTEGRDDPVTISFRPGNYTPVFTVNSAATAAEPAAAQVGEIQEKDDPLPLTARSRGLQLPPRWLAAFLVVILSAGFITGYIWTTRRDINRAAKMALELPIPKPILAVDRFTTLGTQPDQVRMGTELAAEIATNLLRFRTVRVIGPTHGGEEMTGRASEKPDFILGGVLDFSDHALMATVQLTRTDQNRLVWSEHYTRSYDQGDIVTLQAEIARRVAARLGENYGIQPGPAAISENESAGGTYEAYNCILRFASYHWAKEAGEHAQVRDCLEQAVQTAPNYSEAWSALSSVYSDEARFGFNERPDWARRSLDAAKRAVQADPLSAIARRFLARAWLMHGDPKKARDEIARALELNANDPDVLATAGMIMTYTGDPDTGGQILRKAIDLSPIYPAWYTEELAISVFLRGRLNEALALAQQGVQSNSLKSLVVLAAIQARMGKLAEARDTLGRLRARSPRLAANPAAIFGLSGMDRDVAAPLAQALARIKS